MEAIVKRCIIFILLTLTLLPWIQRRYTVFVFEPLKGAIVQKDKPLLNKTEYLSGKFQEKFESYFQFSTGFKEWLIPLYNQIGYSIFKLLRTEDVVLAKDGRTLMDPNYIKSLYGYTYTGESRIDYHIQTLSKLDSVLKSKNKKLIIMFSPGKASFFPELIPDSYAHSGFPTNYSAYKAKFKNTNIAFIDFKKWYISLKGKTDEVLYPLYGIHWSDYGAHWAADSLVRFIENDSQKKLPRKKYTGEVETGGITGKDYDLGEVLNLLKPLSTYKINKPIVEFLSSEKDYKPNVLIVGDSYWWNIYDTQSPDNQFNEYAFLFYFNTAYLNKSQVAKPVYEINLLEEIDKADYIIITTTETNDQRFPFAFPEKVLALYGDTYYESVAEKEKQLQAILDEARFNKGWHDQIIIKAKQNNISVEEQCYRDALWVYNERNKNK